MHVAIGVSKCHYSQLCIMKMFLIICSRNLTKTCEVLNLTSSHKFLIQFANTSNCALLPSVNEHWQICELSILWRGIDTVIVMVSNTNSTNTISNRGPQMRLQFFLQLKDCLEFKNEHLITSVLDKNKITGETVRKKLFITMFFKAIFHCILIFMCIQCETF